MQIRQHAIIRLNQRCSLTPKEVRYILTNEKSCPIGIHGKQKHHVHHLIYSEKDDECFVVIQDTNNEDVITVLPIDYHRAWQIDPDTFELAKKAYYGSQYAAKFCPRPTITKEEEKEIKRLNREVEKKILKQKRVDTIIVAINQKFVSTHLLKYNNVTVTRTKSTTKTICDIKSKDLKSMGFSKDKDINKESFIEEFTHNESFADNFKKEMHDIMIQNKIDFEGIYAYSIILKETQEQFNVKFINKLNVVNVV